MKSNHTPGEWDVCKTGNHQRLICSEEGHNIAVVYEARNAPILAAAPKLFNACKLAQEFVWRAEAGHEQLVKASELEKIIYSALEQATGE